MTEDVDDGVVDPEAATLPPLPPPDAEEDPNAPVGYHKDGMPIHPVEQGMIDSGIKMARAYKGTTRPPWIDSSIWCKWMSVEDRADETKKWHEWLAKYPPREPGKALLAENLKIENGNSRSVSSHFLFLFQSNNFSGKKPEKFDS